MFSADNVSRELWKKPLDVRVYIQSLLLFGITQDRRKLVEITARVLFGQHHRLARAPNLVLVATPPHSGLLPPGGGRLRR